MLRSLKRGIIRLRLEKKNVRRPAKHISNEFQKIRGTKFVEYLDKGGRKKYKEIVLTNEERKSII